MSAPTDHARLVLRDVAETLATDGRHIVSRRLWAAIPPRAELIQVAEVLEASAERRERLVSETREARETPGGPSSIVMRAAAKALRQLADGDVDGAVTTLAQREGQTTGAWLGVASAAAEDSDCDTNTTEAM